MCVAWSLLPPVCFRTVTSASWTENRCWKWWKNHFTWNNSRLGRAKGSVLQISFVRDRLASPLPPVFHWTLNSDFYARILRKVFQSSWMTNEGQLGKGCLGDAAGSSWGRVWQHGRKWRRQDAALIFPLSLLSARAVVLLWELGGCKYDPECEHKAAHSAHHSALESQTRSAAGNQMLCSVPHSALLLPQGFHWWIKSVAIWACCSTGRM